MHSDNWWLGTFIYVCNDCVMRMKLWKDLKEIKDSAGDHPWMVAGDLNIVRFIIK